jgi:hypothetical protein
MGIVEQLAQIRVEEFAQEGIEISLDFARLIVKLETYDSIIRLFLLSDPEISVEKIASFLGVSVRFVKISIERYNREIDEAIARVEVGDFHTHQEVEKMAKEW